MTRVLAVVLCLVSFPAQAASCKVVRYYVAKYGEAAVEQYARSRGAGDKEIAQAKRCLNEHR
ncbi:MAG TPA: hypothetical protein VN815_13240 [Steroidobacteraceae bacterium]|nr:hypothetical protein [Steroidobacteraceae bacterium]